MPGQNKAKIVATLGPASSSPEVIRALLEAGADVFRLNFSHGNHDEHRHRYVGGSNVIVGHSGAMVTSAPRSSLTSDLLCRG
jgi:hypothetical protein